MTVEQSSPINVVLHCMCQPVPLASLVRIAASTRPLRSVDCIYEVASQLWQNGAAPAPSKSSPLHLNGSELSVLHVAIRTPHQPQTSPLRRRCSVPYERMLLRSSGTLHPLLASLLFAALGSPHLFSFTSSFCVPVTAFQHSLRIQYIVKGTCTSSKFSPQCARQGARFRQAPHRECSVTLHDGGDGDEKSTSFSADEGAPQTVAPQSNQKRLFRPPRGGKAAVPEYGPVITEDTKTDASASVLFPTRTKPTPANGQMSAVSKTDGSMGKQIIFLHGSKGDEMGGASAKRWARRLRTGVHVPWSRLVLPSGFVDQSSGSKERVWLNRDGRGGIESSLKYIESLVAMQVRKGIPSERIVLAGEGQGATMCVIAAMLLEGRLGGVVAINAAPLPSTIAFQPPQASRSTPFFFWHAPEHDTAQSVLETALKLGMRCEAQPEVEQTGLVTRVLRRYRAWGSKCRDAVDEFLWSAIPDDVEAIPELDLWDGVRGRPAPRELALARAERFLPLPRLSGRGIAAMRVEEVQVALQFHGLRFDDVVSETEARRRLQSAAQAASRAAAGPEGGAGWRRGGVGADGRRMSEEEWARVAMEQGVQVGRNFWEAGAQFAGSAAEKMRSGEDATQVARDLWETGRSTVEGAYGEMNREWARGGGNEGRRSGESEGKRKQRLLSAEEWYERYNTTGSLDDPPMLDLDDEDFAMYDKPKVGWGVLNVKDRKFDRVVPDKAADAVETVARKGVNWLNTMLKDDPRGAYSSPYQRVAPQPEYGSRWDVPDTAQYQGGYQSGNQPPPRPYPSPGPAQYQQGGGYAAGPAYGNEAMGNRYMAPNPGSNDGFGAAGSGPPAPAAVRRDTFSFDPPPRAQPFMDMDAAPRVPGRGVVGADGEQGFGTGPVASFKFEIFGVAEANVLGMAATNKAQELGIGGWLHFTDDFCEHQIEGVAEGPESQARRFVDWICGVGAPGCVIEGSLVSELRRSDKPKHDRFEIL